MSREIDLDATTSRGTTGSAVSLTAEVSGPATTDRAAVPDRSDPLMRLGAIKLISPEHMRSGAIANTNDRG